MTARRDSVVLGVDEAGRGPALGPMVVAAVAVTGEQEAALRRLGVRDSKAFGSSPRARALRGSLVPRIEACCVFTGRRVVEVDEVDAEVARGGLNRLERRVALELLHRAPTVDRVICDGARVFGPLSRSVSNLVAVDHGEDEHVAVAAASILAKARRDELFHVIAQRYLREFGPVTGGGYCNAGTRAFLRAYAERYAALPPEARRSWPYDYLLDLLGPPPHGDGELPLAHPRRRTAKR